MKNLKYLNVEQDTGIEADSFCYCNNNFYFAATNKIYRYSNDPQDPSELKFCAELEPEYDKTHSVIGIEFLEWLDSDKLFIASSSGEIFLYDIDSMEVSSVGVVESGLQNFAWSPDQEVLVLLTGANTLILMTQNFDPIVEKSLCPDEFGESKPITVGWGSKETQFHGSEGKDAAKVTKIEPKPALPYDTGRPHISWRRCGAYFITSSIHATKGYRQLRVWDREAVLQFTCETKDGLEEPLCWRRSNNPAMACSQQIANKHKIIFFERNGLQHSEFTLPFTPNSHKVTHISWNCDSLALLVAAQPIENPSYSQVMLWTFGNYHWYLKQTFHLQHDGSAKSLVIKWATHCPLEFWILNQATQTFYKFSLTFTISSSLCDDDALVVSTDNDNILITPFGKMVVPPPMCAYSYNLPSAVHSVFFAPHSPNFCCYLGNFKLALFAKKSQDDNQISDDCKLKLVAAGGSGFKSKIKPYVFQKILRLNIKGIETSDFGLCHWTWTKENRLLCVCSYKLDNFTKYGLILFELMDSSLDELPGSLISNLECSVVGICTNKSGNLVAVQLANGKILKMNIDETSRLSEASLVPWLCDDYSPLVLPGPCHPMSIISVCEMDYFLGLSKCCLYLNNSVILRSCTSFCIHDEYLLATDVNVEKEADLLKCFLIDYDLLDMKNSKVPSDIPSQRLENRAKIVTSPPNSTKVILQMPRGNLETIHPRPLVLLCVCKHLDKLQFAEAFELSKVHRIDLNILYDHNPEVFLNNVQLFVKQLNSTSNINLFLASLKNEDICESLYPFAYKGKIRPSQLTLENNKIDVICNAVRDVIDAMNEDRFFLSLIATYAKKTEPELEQALVRLKGMKDFGSKSNQVLVDSALNFLLYLVDVNELIDVALGTYDLEITIMVAQKSQKDPKEFLPFYNELQRMEENYKKFKIDMHLRRYKLALQHISKSEEHFDECLTLIRDQRLYMDSLHLFPPSSDKYKVIWKEYGSYLMEKRYYDEAGLVFTRCEDFEKALLAYKESLNWQSMLCAAMQLSYSDDKIILLCKETSEKLKSYQRYLEASLLLEQYVKDFEESIVTLIEGCEWNAALLLMSKYKRNDISETHLKPALHEHYSYLNSHLEQLSNDFRTHTERLKVLRTEKRKEAELPDIVKHHDEELFSETESVTDAASLTSSVAESKQLSGSIMTRKSSKSRRKQKLKKYRLKEGSPDEDLAHIAALSEIVIKIDNLKDNFLNTLKTLVRFGFDSKAESLQKQMCSLVSLVESEMPDIWRPVGKDFTQFEMKYGPESTSNSITALLQSEKASPCNLKIDPELSQPHWRKMDLSLLMFK